MFVLSNVLYKSCTSFVTFIPESFILFDAIVNGSICQLSMELYHSCPIFYGDF